MLLAMSIAIPMSVRAALLPLDLCTELLWDDRQEVCWIIL